jgi:hypothetical protein
VGRQQTGWTGRVVAARDRAGGIESNAEYEDDQSSPILSVVFELTGRDWVRLFRRRNEQPVNPEERSPRLGVKIKDLVVMNRLMQAGADLSKSRHVIHFFYSRSAESAQTLADSAREQPGWEVKVGEPLPEYPGRWSVVCETHAVVSAEFVRNTGDLFDSLAARHQAEYDGWEAAV